MSLYTVESQLTSRQVIVNYQFSIGEIQVVIVAGFHLFPFRTEKLSPPAPMVLHTRGRVGSRRFLIQPFERNLGGFSAFIDGQLSHGSVGEEGLQRKD